MNEFVLFQSFMNDSDALPVIEVLQENKIEYQVEKFKEPLDRVFAGEVVRDQFYLKIRSQDFSKANEVLDQMILKNISSLEKDYYLFTFSNEELLDIIKKPDEWSRQDYLIARKILGERGKPVNEPEVNTLRSQRIKELAAEEKQPVASIIVGYIFAFVFSLVGVFFGLAFLVTKKTLPDGSRVFAYTQGTRNHGKVIFILSLAMLIVYIITNAGLLFFVYKFF